MEQKTENSAPIADTEEKASDHSETKIVGEKTEKKKVGEAFKDYFTASRIAYIAVFTAISYILYLLDFPLLPSSPVSFLKLDFSNVFVMIGGFALGPVAGVIIAFLKELIHALTVGNTYFVGELANLLFVVPYMLIPAIVYKYKKGIKSVILTLALGCIAQCVVSIPVNYWLNFPVFFWAWGGAWEAGQQLFLEVWYWAVLFNLIKTVLVSVCVFLLYKPLSRLIKITNAKFSSLKSKKNISVHESED